MVERGGLSIEATIGVITRRYNLSGVNFTPSSLDENILRLSVIVEMIEATRSTRGNSNFPKKGKKSLSKYCLFEKKAKISRVTRVIYLDFGRCVRSRRWKHQIPLVAFETRSGMLTREQKRKQQETPHGDGPSVAERMCRKSFGVESR